MLHVTLISNLKNKLLFILYIGCSLKTTWHTHKEIRACYFLLQCILNKLETVSYKY